MRLAELRPYGAELVTDWPDPIVIVEGEATADALRALGIAGVGTLGTSYQPEPAALAPLAGRRCIIWPDADPKGRTHGLDIAARLEGIAAGVDWIEPPPDVFAGWDAADADPDTAARLIATAGPLPESVGPSIGSRTAADLRHGTPPPQLVPPFSRRRVRPSSTPVAGQAKG